MASTTWPDLLPSGILAAGFSKKPQNNVIRTSIDAGPNKARRRYTARSVKYSGKQVFDKLELAVFEQFFHTVLADGVLRFNFEDPITSEIAEFRFTNDYSVSDNGGLFEVAMQMERL